MNRLLFAGCWMAAVLAGVLPRPADAAPPSFPTTNVFYVAPDGNDYWSGRLSAANWAKTDGPFATVGRAVAAVREARAAGVGAKQAAAVLLHGGLYCLAEPLRLTPMDSNLMIEACAGEKPILSGGRRIQSWRGVRVDGKRLWAAELPEVAQGKWFFHELWVNGRRAVRARHPNQGYLAVEAVPEPRTNWMQGHTSFRFRPGDLQAWRTITEAEVIVMNRWVESRLPVFIVDEQERTVSFSKSSVFQLDPKDPYYLEGAWEALDQPGEWYLDRLRGMLYYLPLPGETLGRIEAIAPALRQIVRLEGRTESNQFVSRVVLRGLGFEHAEWCFPKGFAEGRDLPEVDPAPRADVGGFAQAAVGVPGAVWGRGAIECSLESCTFKHLGTYGLELGRGCRTNRILGCEFSDLGAGGIKVGETAIRERLSERTGENEISDCTICDGGKLFQSAVGIWVGQSGGNRITHNRIYDFYYTGISIGWTWGYGPALAGNNYVAFNHVHHLGAKLDGDGPVLSDMGGIYTLGKQPGTRIENNLWHHISAVRYGGWGIYFDEGSSGIVAVSNVVYRTTHGGFHQHYGETNFVWNNIFASARDGQLQRSRVEPHTSFTFQTNIVWFDSGQLLAGNWAEDRYGMDWNLYFDARADGSAPLRFADDNLDRWRSRGHDAHSLHADPLFADPKANDFRLKPGSPAFKLGFQPIDLGSVGPRRAAAVPAPPAGRTARRPFTLVQVGDPQFGFDNYEAELHRFRSAVRQINALCPDLVVVCGDVVNSPSEKTFGDFNAARKALTMPCLVAAGNHDLGNTPTVESLALFRRLVGPDFFSFPHKGYLFVVVNAQLWKAPVPGETEKQDAWLKATLERAARKQQPVIVVSHYPLFVREPDEPDAYFNLAPAKRKELLDLFERCGVEAILAGHTHTTSMLEYHGIQMVTSENTSRNFDKRPFGFRVWRLGATPPFAHEFVPVLE